MCNSMYARIEKILSEWVQINNFFVVDERIQIPL